MPAKRGFSSMDKNKQREIASKGGKAAHQKGTAHQFTSEEARLAGKKGGAASRARRSLNPSTDSITTDQPSEDNGEPAATQQ